MNQKITNLPTVSVIIPTFNRAETILAAVVSVINQSYPVTEIIVVDDCSQDNTRGVLASIQDSRLRIVRSQKQSGAAAARNLGVKHAKGLWIAFQDSDDYWFAHKLEKQMELVKNFPDAILYYSRFIQYYAGKIELVPHQSFKHTSGFVKDDLLLSNFVSTQTILMKRSCFEDVGGFNESLPALEDWEFALRVTSLGALCCVEEPLIIAYDTPGSLTRNVQKGIDARLKILADHQAEYAQRHDLIAHHLHVVGKTYLQTGNLRQARYYFWKSLRNRPIRFNTLFWFSVAFCKSLLTLRKPQSHN
jgi:glycosyltransferase involved in cell wall biosynthesis